MGEGYDSVNAVERVYIPSERLAAGVYTILVGAYQRSASSKDGHYAIAAAFPGDGQAAAAGSECPAPDRCPLACQGEGSTCQGLRCKCGPGRYGAACQHVVPTAPTFGVWETVTIPSMEWRYLRFTVPPHASVLIRARSFGAGDPDYYVQQLQLPTTRDFLIKNTSCDNCYIRSETETSLTELAFSGHTEDGSRDYYLGILTAQCCEGAVVSVSIGLVSCSAACDSLEVAPPGPHKRHQLCGCDIAAAHEGPSTVLYGHWVLFHTIPCYSTDCTARCREGCDMESIYGMCNEDGRHGLCECFTNFTASERISPPGTASTTYSCLQRRCSEHPFFKAPNGFAGPRCTLQESEQGSVLERGWTLVIVLFLGILVISLSALAWVFIPRRRSTRWQDTENWAPEATEMAAMNQ
eukprot:NODE_1501_length_1510_cov_33.722793_g1354_i0.p1 GENE.NODE_1501_length_1510_cov_33.722793_g1354_i0~~NODE_1501_length_1510_cov_33.722793_g1354_i0.p1  ORF type:complete len:438 (-),score=54.41 NODE_1501_length_1510_cov_33.722793_g1354_i0:197-1423(-)